MFVNWTLCNRTWTFKSESLLSTSIPLCCDFCTALTIWLKCRLYIAELSSVHAGKAINVTANEPTHRALYPTRQLHLITRSASISLPSWRKRSESSHFYRAARKWLMIVRAAMFVFPRALSCVVVVVVVDWNEPRQTIGIYFTHYVIKTFHCFADFRCEATQLKWNAKRGYAVAISK